MSASHEDDPWIPRMLFIVAFCILAIALSAVFKEEKEKTELPQGLEDCQRFLVGDLTVIRCPNSTTAVIRKGKYATNVQTIENGN